MKLIIDIPEKLAKKQWYTDKEIRTVINTVWNGTPIPDNATVCDIDAIRDEMMDAYDDNRAHDMGDVAYGIKIALQIMMEHMKGE